MIEELGDIESPSGLPGFDGEGSEVHYFNHVTALAVRAILRQFDNSSRDVQGGRDAIDARLRELAGELEAEEIQANAKRQRGEQSKEQREEEKEQKNTESDSEEDDFDFKSLTPEEQAEFKQELRPIKLAIAKVSGIY